MEAALPNTAPNVDPFIAEMFADLELTQTEIRAYTTHPSREGQNQARKPSRDYETPPRSEAAC